MAVHIPVFVLLTQPDAARMTGDMNKIRMGSLLTSLIFYIIPGWTRREATLTTHSEGRLAP